MAFSKVILNGTTLMDVTSNTNAANNMLSGTTGTKNDGTSVIGNIATKTSSDMTVSGATVTAPAGYYASNASKSVASGSVTMPASIDGGNTSISISSGKITLSKSVSATPSVTTAGYVSSGTAGNTTISLSATAASLGATTYTPTTSQQTIINAGTYVYGTQKIDAIPSGTAGTPTATKGTVSNHSVSITPSVTNTTGYITGSTINGTAVTVSASELVSDTLTVIENGQVDVTNYQYIDVAVPTTPDSLVPASAFTDYLTHIGYYFNADSPVSAYTVYLGITADPADCTTISWGDNNTTTTDTSDYKIYSHTYLSAPSDGYYNITLSAPSGAFELHDDSATTGPVDLRAFGDATNPMYMANGTRIRWVVLGKGYRFGYFQNSDFQECAGLEEVWYQTNSTLYSTQVPRYYTFKDAVRLKKIGIKTPNRFQYRGLGAYSFSGCKSLESLDFSDLPSGGSLSVGEGVFQNCWNLKTVVFANMTAAMTVDIYAFQNCYSLEKFTFSTTGNVTIKAQAFEGCSSLAELHFRSSTPPTVNNSNAWTGIPSTCKIYVPTGSLSAYTSATNMPNPSIYTYTEE